jgi:hypothetical protein
MTAMSDRGRIALCVAMSVVLGFVFIGLDLPSPGIDDLFYLGASLNYANTGSFTNPYLALQEWPFPFFAQTYPTQSAAVIPWLKIFGASFSSLGGLYNIFYFGTALLLAAALARGRFSLWIFATLLLATLFVALHHGFRTEPLAVALMAAGLFCLTRTSFVARILAGFFLAAGILCALRWAAAFAIVALFFWLRAASERRSDLRSLIIDAALLAGGGALALIYIFYFIDYRVAELFAGLRLHAQARHSGFMQIGFARPIVASFLLLAAVIVSLIPAFKTASTRREIAGTAIFAALLVVIGLAQSAFGTFGANDFNFLAAIVLIALYAQAHPRVLVWHKAGILAVLFALVALSNLSTSMDLFARLRGQSYVCGEQCRALALASANDRGGGMLLIDGGTARYVFDYKMPPRTIDYMFARHYAGELVPNDPIPCKAQAPDQLWLLSRTAFRWGHDDVMPAPDSVKIVGRNWRTWISPIDETFTIDHCRATRNVPTR